MKNKFVRFRDWSSQNSFNWGRQSNSGDGFSTTRVRRAVSSVWYRVCRGWQIGSERIRRLKKPLKESKDAQAVQAPYNDLGTTKTTILDPQGPFLQRWNKIFVFSCALAISLDPLFFYIPVIDRKNVCIELDKKLETTALVLRTTIDVFYILRIIFQFRTGFIAPSSRVFGRGELVQNPGVIAKRYLASHFIVDILSILPLPQMMILGLIPNLKGPVSMVTKNILKIVIIVQYVPRFMRIYPLYKEVTSTSGILTETAWAGAVFNLVLYMLASHIVGASWYMLSVEREDSCWHDVCKGISTCNSSNFYCGGHKNDTYKYMLDKCSFIDPDDKKNSTQFNFGIFTDALSSGVTDSMDFPKKFFYCFWWGFRGVSSLGQNLNTSTFVPEILFAIFISIAGLVLFALLIGNMQKYLQSTTVRIEGMRVKRRDAEQWMYHRMLPDNVKERIRHYEQYKWQETRGVEEQTLIRSLPKDIRRDINRHLCFELIRKVPLFEKMDEQILDAICDRLKPVLYTKNSCIIREGDPVDEMLFIMRGNLESITTNGGKTGFYNAAYLRPGDFSGEALLTWALDPQPSSNLPISTRTVKALSEVEAFALVAEDLKSVASQFQRLHHKDIQHIFKFHSVQWRTWAASFIQAAWRRYWKRKQAKLLRQAEEDLQDALANEVATLPSLGATLYASSFAAKALRNLRQNGARPGKPPQRLQLLPPKPSEPIFTPHGYTPT